METVNDRACFALVDIKTIALTSINRNGFRAVTCIFTRRWYIDPVKYLRIFCYAIPALSWHNLARKDNFHTFIFRKNEFASFLLTYLYKFASSSWYHIRF